MARTGLRLRNPRQQQHPQQGAGTRTRNPRQQQSAGPSPGELIAAAPTYYLQLYASERTKMAAEYCRSMRDLQRGVTWQSARENSEIEQILEKILVMDRLRGIQHFKYRFTLTPDTGLFKLVIRTPQGWPGSEGAKFLFSFRDLYLCGFQNNLTLRWHIFNDVILPGIAKPRDHPELLVVLPFGGGYGRRSNIGMIMVGLARFAQSCDVIANFTMRSRREIRIALLTIAACVSEPLRFPYWMKKLVMVFQSGGYTTVDGGGDKFSAEFRKWSTRSKVIRKGEARFEESDSEDDDDFSEDDFQDGHRSAKEFPTYECYLPRVGVLLSRPPV